MNRDGVLWLVILAGPVAWMLSFGADFALSGWTCAWRSKLPLHMITLAALVVTGSAAAIAFSRWVAIGKEWPGETGGETARSRVMAITGVALNLMFFIVLIAQAIPQLLLVGCE